MSSRPAIYLVGGPSGAGKDTLLLGAKAQCARTRGAPVVFLTRVVTRPAEQCTEIEHSVTAADFDRTAAAGGHAITWSAHGDTRYAVPRAALDAALSASPPRRIVLNVSRSVFDEVLGRYGHVADVYVLLISASASALRQRLKARGREDAAAIEERIARATAFEPPRADHGHRVLRVFNDTTIDEGIGKVVAALLTPRHVPVLGLVGCSASGKSTLCDAVSNALAGDAYSGGRRAHTQRIVVVDCDRAYKPKEECPKFDLGAIKWPGGGGGAEARGAEAAPEAFRERGNADTNHPGSIDWADVASELDAAVASAAAEDAHNGTSSVVILEGLMLLAADDAVASLRRRVGAWVYLRDDETEAAQEALLRRKWSRSGHLGKRSYKERGVSSKAYAAYWRDYIAPRWREHGGVARLEALGQEGAMNPPFVLDALGSVDANAAALKGEVACLAGWYD